ncbi:hypothetical protein Gpo141_00014592 [Globisporangium polare]
MRAPYFLLATAATITTLITTAAHATEETQQGSVHVRVKIAAPEAASESKSFGFDGAADNENSVDDESADVPFVDEATGDATAFKEDAAPTDDNSAKTMLRSADTAKVHTKESGHEQVKCGTMADRIKDTKLVCQWDHGSYNIFYKMKSGKTFFECKCGSAVWQTYGTFQARPKLWWWIKSDGDEETGCYSRNAAVEWGGSAGEFKDVSCK